MTSGQPDARTVPSPEERALRGSHLAALRFGVASQGYGGGRVDAASRRTVRDLDHRTGMIEGDLGYRTAMIEVLEAGSTGWR